MNTKVLLIINRLEDNGGAEVSTSLLLDGLQGNGFDFAIVTLFGPSMIERRTTLEARGARFLEAPTGAAERIRFLRGFAHRWGPDVIHTTLFDADLVGAVTGCSLGIPTLTSVVGAAYTPGARQFAKSPTKLKLAGRFVSYERRFAFSHIHAITNAVAENAIAGGVAADRITIIPRGRPETGLAARPSDVRDTVRKELSIASSTFVVLNVARHEPPKGQVLLLDAFARLAQERRDVVLVIAGREGSATAEMQRHIRGSGLGEVVRLLGVRNDVARLHVAADVFAFSSRWEGLGGAVLEAMEIGTPIVGFRIPALEEVVGDTGRLVEPFDIEAFASELAYVRDHPLEAHELASQARARFVERYSLAHVNAAMAALYDQVSSGGPPPVSRVFPRRRRRVPVQ